MRSKLNYLINVSLKRKMKTKWFLVANIILFIAIAGIINIDNIIKVFGGDFDKKTKIYVIDETERTYELFHQQLNQVEISLNDDSKFEVILYEKDYETAKIELEESEENDIYIEFIEDEENTLKVKMLTKEYIDAIDLQSLTTAINNSKALLAIGDYNVSVEELAKIYSPVEIVRDYLDDTKTEDDEMTEAKMVGIFSVIILPVFMLTIILVQMIGVEINDEKTTRGMEIIISNVSPVTHFSSKIIASNIFVLLQALLLLIYSGVGILIRKLVGDNSITTQIMTIFTSSFGDLSTTSIYTKLAYILPLTITMLLLTFLAYSLLAGILASMTTNMEDFQQLQTPLMIICVSGYYLAMMSTMFDGSVFIKIVSVIPLISAILAPALLILGQIGIIEIIIALILLILTNYLLIKYGIKIYKVGILNYSSTDLWKKMFKALKE
ncbi:MAG: ABC transporter permease [Bacilli bacterium]|nr:ABC transporter permease [Bacilli bacterium]MDD4734168.1 ABC transporter permease [Bacilli bacterium]